MNSNKLLQLGIKKIDGYFVLQGFVKSKYESTVLYTKFQRDANILIVSLYVTDLIFTENNLTMIRRFKNDMMTSFE